MTSHEYLIWICLFGYAIYIFEEIVFNWRDWAAKILRLKNASWELFYAFNGLILVTGVTNAMVGWNAPTFALILPGYQLINSILLRIAPAAILRQYTPGLVTAIVLLVPLSGLAYYGAYLDDVVDPMTIILSLAIGALLALLPMASLKIQEKYV